MNPVVFLLGAVLLVVPMWLILPRAGLSSYWAFCALIPLGVVVLLWVLALRRWPGDPVGGGQV